jgi:ribosomal protein S18 acetylase RimI-like enzyme
MSISPIEQVQEIIIRPAVMGDASAIGRILVEAFPNVYPSVLGLNVKRAAEAMESLVLDGHINVQEVRIAEYCGKVAGLSVLKRRDNTSVQRSFLDGPETRKRLGTARSLRALFGYRFLLEAFDRRIPHGNVLYLDALAVAEEARRKGIGEALVEDALRIAKQTGADHLALHVVNKKDGARRLYEKMGFVQVEDSRTAPRFFKSVERLLGQWVSQHGASMMVHDLKDEDEG